MIDPDVMAALRALPRRAKSTWQGSRRPTAAQIENQGPLDLMIWLDSGTRQIRTGMVAPRGAGGDAMWTALVQAMTDPAGDLKPFRPGKVALEDDASRAYVAQALQDLGIELVTWQASNVLDDAFDNMEGTLSRGPGPTYLDKPDNTPERMAPFFEAAVDLFEAAPWEGRPDTQPVRLRGLDPSPLLVSLLGDAGEEFGVAIYLTQAAAQAVIQSEDPAEATRQPVLMMTYTHPDEAGPGILAEASTHEWKLVDAECLPLLARSDRPDDFVAHGSEVDLATDVMRVLVLAMRADQPFRPGPVKLPDGRVIEVDWPA
jgi:hypothetical protein